MGSEITIDQVFQGLCCLGQAMLAVAGIFIAAMIILAWLESKDRENKQ